MYCFALVFIWSCWCKLVPFDVEPFSLIFNDPHMLTVHMLSYVNIQHVTVMVYCLWPGMGRRGAHMYSWNKYFIFLYIGRLPIGVNQIVPDIRQRTSNPNVSFICTHRCVLNCACFELVYGCKLVLINFDWFSLIFTDFRTFPLHMLPSSCIASQQ